MITSSTQSSSVRASNSDGVAVAGGITPVYRPTTASAVDVAMNTQRGRLGGVRRPIRPPGPDPGSDRSGRARGRRRRNPSTRQGQRPLDCAGSTAARDARQPSARARSIIARAEREPDSSSPRLGDDDHEDLPVVVDTGETHDASLMEGSDPEAGLARAHPRDERRKRLRPGAIEPAEVPRFRPDLVGEPVDADRRGSDDRRR